eukprot:TRINITY_DN11955_c0_g1::TRINITY_DN11955_c0_g1_i1::g.16917::m.16917 TRINITY_DN11955_c0_g1::TRINITY_DN11955_c0_g1_i1::g.16917  ORF type:complete len:612 (-),score=151.45,sp/Q8GWT4/ANM15_ARATH/47.78/0.0,PRMT5/PF05185.11/1.9e-169,Methyltransf_26/PF13659.1/0.065,Met_10/PF02475.11/0.049,Methyltransf_20/PF12147.3/0.093 TRINITY_DN11955_c0_g1_i1:440-2275(-)
MPVARQNHPDNLYLGVQKSYAPDLHAVLEQARQDEFDFACVPLVHPRYERDFKNKDVCLRRIRTEPLTRSDLLLDSSQWNSTVVGLVSSWIDCDSPVSTRRKNSELALAEEIKWAAHLAIPAVIAPSPRLDCTNYASRVNGILLSLNYLQFWLNVRMTDFDGDENRPWDAWNRFRTLCEQHPLLAVALELTSDLPSQAAVERWLGEPVKAVIVPTSIFLTNKKGYPTLSRRHQEVMGEFFRYKIQVIISGRPQHPAGMKPYVQYIAYLFQKQAGLSESEQFEHSYLDYLQCPLQPLMDNLESATYETFEKDPVKYAEYENAIYQALITRHKEDEEIILMVVGAGRGPLVKCALRARERSQRINMRVYAVEKNPNAVITLHNMKISENWGNLVTIVAGDMRQWEAPVKADILVSELLGSFGDNELSPECLDGAQRYLKNGGVSIPQDYTAFLRPTLSSKLWNEVKQYKDQKYYETPYVVKVHNAMHFGPAKACWKFEHPNLQDPIDNTRSVRLHWNAEVSGVIHGFTGYFHSKLFEEVCLSIAPETFSTGMFSWFPIFFPLRNPVPVKAGETIEVAFWRKMDDKKVWYEWALVSPQATPIHNPNGRSYFIGL